MHDNCWSRLLYAALNCKILELNRFQCHLWIQWWYFHNQSVFYSTDGCGQQENNGRFLHQQFVVFVFCSRRWTSCWWVNNVTSIRVRELFRRAQARGLDRKCSTFWAQCVRYKRTKGHLTLVTWLRTITIDEFHKTWWLWLRDVLVDVITERYNNSM